jgi:DNA polymerase
MRRLELEKMMGVDALLTGGAAPEGGQPEVSDNREEELRKIEQEVMNCTRCPLHETRTQGVFARGDAHAALMFVGEAPGQQEDLTGEPFVGPAGKLLDSMVFAMGMERDEIYVTNILKSRPPNNRDPRPDEVQACMPYLERQIDLIQPRVICTLGRPAANALLMRNASMGSLRGRWHTYRGIPLMPTYHPAYLLRSPGQKKKTWQDLKMIVLALQREPDYVPGV